MCNVLCHAGVTTTTTLSSPAVRNRNAHWQNEPLKPVHHVAMGQRLPNFCRKNPTEKSNSGTGKPSRSCLVAAFKLVLLSQLARTSACTLSCCFYTSAFFFFFLSSLFIGIFICLLELIGFNGATYLDF